MREVLSFTGLFITFLLFLCGGFYWMVHETDETLTKMDKDFKSITEKAAEEARIEKENVLKKGKKLDALVIDKYSTTDSSMDFTVTPVVIGGGTYMMSAATPGASTESYYIKIYADEKNYDITVPKEVYDQKQVGLRIPIKLYKDKIELL
ncbi:hypothetical protein [Bacillus sp. FSL W8-1202]|uniref:hypothetical protein n=1 Tax=Bacillus TaxID=1386 RepID=UPI0030FCB8DE